MSPSESSQLDLFPETTLDISDRRPRTVTIVLTDLPDLDDFSISVDITPEPGLVETAAIRAATHAIEAILSSLVPDANVITLEN